MFGLRVQEQEKSTHTGRNKIFEHLKVASIKRNITPHFPVINIPEFHRQMALSVSHYAHLKTYRCHYVFFHS